MNGFLHPGRFRPQFLGLSEQIRDIRIVKQRPLEQIGRLPDENMVHVRTDRELADQHILPREAGGDGSRNFGGNFGILFSGRIDNVVVQPVPALTAPVDTV